jgi:hypothetical protein
MRYTVRLTALVLVLLVLLVPVATSAKGGPCPDDPVGSRNCARKAPPYYVVSNRSFERLGPEYGTGCRPWILENPDCTDCEDDSDECHAAAVDVEQIICGGEMPKAGAEEGDILFEMCCNCAGNSNGQWMWRERVLQYREVSDNNGEGVWECPDPGPWERGLPPNTGIDLPAPIMIGGLAVIGASLLAVGVFIRRRTPSAA